MQKALAAFSLTTVLAVSGCDADLDWPETGIWACENKLNGQKLTFDTRNNYKAGYDLKSMFMIVKDLNKDVNVEIRDNQGWVCEMPSGKEFRFETDLG